MSASQEMATPATEARNAMSEDFLLRRADARMLVPDNIEHIIPNSDSQAGSREERL